MPTSTKFKNPKYSKLITQNQIEMQIWNFLRALIGNRYVYENLPPELDRDIIEEFLFNKGQLIGFKFGDAYFCLPCTTYDLNVYGKPMSATPIALNGITFPNYNLEDTYSFGQGGAIKTGEKNAVLIYQNIERTSTIYLLSPFVDRLTILWTNLGFNACYTRLKAVIQANASDAKVIEAVLYQIFGNNKPFTLVSDKNNMLEQINKVDLDVENQADAIWDDFDRTWNLLLTFCGVNNNNNANKKERMITDEVNANNQLIQSFSDNGLKYRQKCFDEFNKLFGTNIQVKLNEEVFKQEDEEVIKDDINVKKEETEK